MAHAGSPPVHTHLEDVIGSTVVIWLDSLARSREMLLARGAREVVAASSVRRAAGVYAARETRSPLHSEGNQVTATQWHSEWGQ